MASITPAYTPVSPALLGNPTTAPTAKNELDRDAFMKLLVAQMKYQDPTAPMDTSALMAQTSQLASVEQLTALADTSRSSFDVQQRLGAAALVGRSVTWTGTDGTTSSGTVAAVDLSGGTPMLRVGETSVPLADVTAVVAAPASLPAAAPAPAAASPAAAPPAASAPASTTPSP